MPTTTWEFFRFCVAVEFCAAPLSRRPSSWLPVACECESLLPSVSASAGERCWGERERREFTAARLCLQSWFSFIDESICRIPHNFIASNHLQTETLFGDLRVTPLQVGLNLFPLEVYYRLALELNLIALPAGVAASSRWSVLRLQVDHIPQSYGLKVESVATNFSVSYSGDTRPCEGFFSAAAACDVVIHEGQAV